MPGHQPVLVDQPDFVHRGDHGQLAVGVLHRHGVAVGVEPHQRLAIGRSLADPAGLERLPGQGQEGGLVLQQQFVLGAGLAARPMRQVGLAARHERHVQRRQRADLRHRHQEVLAGEAQQPFDVPLLVGAAAPGRSAPGTGNGSAAAGTRGSASARGP